jgi:hypothetical protein
MTMGELASFYRDWDAMSKEQREQRFHGNVAVIEEAGMAYEWNKDRTAMLLREPGKPKVDFYPGTGTWKAGNKGLKGGAVAFIGWYRKQRQPGRAAS